MLVIDASCLYEVLVDGPSAESVRRSFGSDSDHAAPHVIDVEVLGALRRDHVRGSLDATATSQAVDDLRTWPVDRFGHCSLLERAWELRDRVRAWDAMYVALAEALGASVLTLDRRLARVRDLECPIEMPAV